VLVLWAVQLVESSTLAATAVLWDEVQSPDEANLCVSLQLRHPCSTHHIG
jgi:hypothetical protein